MENTEPSPTPAEAAAALNAAAASRQQLAAGLVLPSHFYPAIGAAVALQIASTAVEVADDSGWGRIWLVAGVLVFLFVAAGQLIRFRRANGVWVGGVASRLVGGTANAASTSYALAMTAATVAAFSAQWWLVALSALAGGVAYGLSGRHWLRSYRADPATHSRGDSAAWLAVLGLTAGAGLVLLVAGS